MSDQLPVLASEATELQLTATKPVEMEQCQHGLIEWCRRKILAVKAEADELQASCAEAIKRKWKHSTIKRHADLAIKRMQFYEKIKSALEHGYIIVPNFPVMAFAIRTDKKKPLALIDTNRWDDHEQKCQTLPAGEGEYKNPLPEIWQDATPTEKNPNLKTYWAEKWAELDFPINMAKPHIMEAADNAMALKIFDELGILPSPYRKKDPLIVGRIRDPKASKYDRDAVVTFIIAWHLDTRTL